MVIQYKVLAGETALNGKPQLLEDTPGVVALHAHPCKLVLQTVSMHEMRHYHIVRRSFAQVELGPRFAFHWDGIGRLRTVKKLSCSVQKSINKRDGVVWKQITEVEYKVEDP